MTDFDPLDTFRQSEGDLDAARQARIRAEFRTRVATLPPDDHGRRPFDPQVTRSRPHRHARRPVLALASLVVLLGLVSGMAFWLREDRPGTAPLQDLAATAGAQPDVSLDDSQYLHRTEQAATADAPAIQRERWTKRDGTGQEIVSSMQLGPPGTTVPSLTVYTEAGSLQFAGLTYDDLRQLPTDATGLLQRLRNLGVITSDKPADQAEALADVLALDVTPPGVASAAVEALGLVGGVVTGPVTDATGRSGTGIGATNDDGSRWVVVVDPSTGRAIAFHANVAAGADLSSSVPYRAWIDQDIADTLPPQN